MSDTFIASGVMRWSRPPALSRAGQLARLHLIPPPPGSPRSIASAADLGRINGYFTARRLGMTPAQIVASRTRASEGRRSPWAPR